MYMKPEYMLINEYDLSNKLLEATNGDATIVFDKSTRQYKVLSKENFIRTKVLEVLIVPKDEINFGLIYRLLKNDADRNRLSRNSKREMKVRTLKNFERNKENYTKDFLTKIKLNRGRTI